MDTFLALLKGIRFDKSLDFKMQIYPSLTSDISRSNE